MQTARGFSLIEVLVVVALMAILAGIAVPLSSRLITAAKADSSVEATIRAIGSARDLAVAQRRNIELTFILPDKLRLERQNVDQLGVTTGKTTLSEVALENGQQFLKYTGIPDTPDMFGASSAVTFNGTAPFMFTSDGSLVDSNGDVSNGSVFVGMPNQPLTARAVTIFGVTGKMRAWKWRGNSWLE